MSIFKRKVTWEELKEYIRIKNTGEKQPDLYRSLVESIKYYQHKEQVGDVNSYLLTKVLRDKKYILVVNSFPYYLEDNILHYLIWIAPNYSLSSDKIKCIVEERFSDQPYLIYKNYDEYQSIKSIEHYHVFIKI